jgi:hypothetical protein
MATSQDKATMQAAQVAINSLWTRKNNPTDHTWIMHLYDLMVTYGNSGTLGGSLFGGDWTAAKKAEVDQMLNNLWRAGGQDQADSLALSHFMKMDRNAIRDLGNLATPNTDPNKVNRNPGIVPTPSLVSVTGFLSALANPNTWLRVAEVGLGVILLAVGIAKLTNAVPVATKIAKVL